MKYLSMDIKCIRTVVSPAALFISGVLIFLQLYPWNNSSCPLFSSQNHNFMLCLNFSTRKVFGIDLLNLAWCLHCLLMLQYVPELSFCGRIISLLLLWNSYLTLQAAEWEENQRDLPTWLLSQSRRAIQIMWLGMRSEGLYYCSDS